MYLVDANVLINAVNPTSADHGSARTWLNDALADRSRTLGIPWIAAIAFLRITTNARVFPAPMKPERALGIIRGWLDEPHVVALDPEPPHLDFLDHLASRADISGNTANDAHIAAIAMDYGATIVTYDTDFALFGVDILRPRAA